MKQTNRCETLCQHPHCWLNKDHYNVDVMANQSYSISETADNHLKLPTQSIKNLSEDYGVYESHPDHYNQSKLWKLSNKELEHESNRLRQRCKTVNSNHRYFSAAEFGDTAATQPAQITYKNILNTEVMNFDNFVSKHYVWVPNPIETTREKPRALTSEINVTRLVLPVDNNKPQEGRALKSRRIHNSSLTRSFQRMKTSSESLPELKSSIADGSTPQKHLIFQVSQRNLTQLSSDYALRNFKVSKKDKAELSDDLAGKQEETKEISPRPYLSATRKNSGILSTPQRVTKIPSISLGLPELPSGVKITRPFTYKKLDLNFTLGPVLSALSTLRSNESIESTERELTRLSQQDVAVDQKIPVSASHQRSVSIYMPESPFKLNDLPDRNFSPIENNDFQNITHSSQQSEHNANYRSSVTPMDTSSIYSKHNSAISPEKMLEIEKISRPNSVATNSTTNVWPTIVEAAEERNVTFESSKSFSRSRSKGLMETVVQPDGITKLNSSKAKSPAPPPPSPELKKQDIPTSPELTGHIISTSPELNNHVISTSPEKIDHLISTSPELNNNTITTSQENMKLSQHNIPISVEPIPTSLNNN